MSIDSQFPKSGVLVLPEVISSDLNAKLRDAYFECYEQCRRLQEKYGIASVTTNTVHHVFFMNEAFAELLECSDYMSTIQTFFGGSKFILNSLGGNNNTGKQNYASEVHRDVRFFSQDPLMLNTIIAVSGFTEINGPTEFLLGSQNKAEKPTKEEFDKNCVSFTCPPGSIVFFDSRIWHRAGAPTGPVDERIIYTPIFTRTFVKQGYNYARRLNENGADKYSEHIAQLMGYFSDVPNNHDQWYNLSDRRYYLAGQDE